MKNLRKEKYQKFEINSIEENSIKEINNDPMNTNTNSNLDIKKYINSNSNLKPISILKDLENIINPPLF